MKKRIISIALAFTLMFSCVQVFAVSNNFGSTYVYASTSVATDGSTLNVSATGSEEVVTPNGVGSITVKVLYKVLKNNKSKIINAVKKVNKNWGTKLESKYDKFLNYIETAKGGVEAVLVKALMKIGFKESNAEIIADAIITVVGLLV